MVLSFANYWNNWKKTPIIDWCVFNHDWKWRKKVNKTFVNCFVNQSIHNARQYWKNFFLFVLQWRNCFVYRNEVFYLKKSVLKQNSKQKQFFNYTRPLVITKKEFIKITHMLRRVRKQNKNWFDDYYDTKNKQIKKIFDFFARHSARKIKNTKKNYISNKINHIEFAKLFITNTFHC